MKNLKIEGRVKFILQLNPEKTDVLITIDLEIDNKKHHSPNVNMEELKFRTATILGAFLTIDQVKIESTKHRRAGNFEKATIVEEIGKPLAQHFMKYLHHIRNYMLTGKL